MRLLQSDGDGNLSLAEFFGDDMPKYAILSHRWEAGEVTFKDMKDGTSKGKAGYGKIQFCGVQARRDGLEYFWVDTCCIDKSSSAELSEAINSMFRWYQKATRCYVYLSDVTIRKRKENDRSAECTWESAFRASKWFIRGWTLQELLAPRSVEFFSREGHGLGDKRILEQQIHEITGIPTTALQDNPLSQFDVDERFSWARSRETTRAEDKAYSLFGIFDVQMPLLYGEGKVKAFQRLRDAIDIPFKGPEKDLLSLLPFATNAPFNSRDHEHEPACLPETRVDLLQEIYGWADGKDGQDEQRIFWLNGLAGMGKSTISRTVAHEYNEQKRLGASFFFSKGGGDAGHAGMFFTTLAVQLARNVPSLRQYICEAAKNRNDIASLSLSEQWRQLVLSPLSNLHSQSCQTYIIVLDALDECEDDKDVRIILQLLAEARSLTTVQLRIFLTSRPEIPIRHGIRSIPQAEHQDFVLHNIQPMIINHDIFLFLEHHLGIIGQELNIGAGWPGGEVLRQLVEYASGLFIWASTTCRFIREGRRFARKRLDTILKGSSSAVTAPEKHLNEIYLTVLKHSISSDYSDEEKEEACDMLKHLLGSTVVLLSPLSTSALRRLLQVSRVDVNSTFDDLHAILDIPKDPTRPLRLHHPSFRDFLLSKDRCGGYWVDEKEAHKLVATSCIQLMSQTLKKDICDMHAPGTQASQVDCSCLQEYLPPEVQYACLYWVQHLQRSGAQASDGEDVYRFLQAHLLHWLEALGWMGKISEGIQAILALESHVLRFVLYNRSAIEQAPLQLYCSALVFAPENSIVRRNFERCIPGWIILKPKVPKNWSAALQTLEGHTGWVSSVAFSADGKQVVSGSLDRTVRLWDTATGALLQTLEGHIQSVCSVAFSPDGKQVVSGSDGGTVRLWDAITGAVLQTLEGHFGGATVAFSPDGKQVVSGSADHTVRLWDAATGTLQQTLEGQTGEVASVAFSPDGKQVVSADECTVRLWEAAAGTLQQTLECHIESVCSVAFSPDGQQVVSGSADHTVRLWDAATGALLQTLEGHIQSVCSVAFSPDGKQVVSGSDDGTVRLWDPITGAVLQTLEGNTGCVSSVAFSPDGKQVVSGSADHTVRLWDAATEALQRTLEGHTGSVSSLAFSPDGKQVVSGSWDRTTRLWDATTGVLLQTLEGHTDPVISVAFSPDGKQVVSGSGDHTVRHFDNATRALVQTAEVHIGCVTTVTSSPESKQVASGSGYHTARLWDAATGALLQTLEGHTGSVSPVAFSLDGKQVVSGSSDGTARLWDTATRALLQTLEGGIKRVTSVAFSPDGKQVALGSSGRTVRLWDTATGALLQTLEGRIGCVSSVTFSPDADARGPHWLCLSRGLLTRQQAIADLTSI
ncbi:hypothetical protein ACEPPN_019021 [Leptodophora sp. 'Broadleaf-Isolate-01']